MLLRVVLNILPRGAALFIADERDVYHRLKVNYLLVEHGQAFPTRLANERADIAWWPGGA